MSRSKLQRINAAVSQFLFKASRKNEPLEAFRETESFTQFKGKMAGGISKQAAWLKKHLHEVDYLQDDSLSDSQFSAKFGQWLGNEMPAITQYVSQEKIYAYLFNAFVWSVEAQYGRYNVAIKKNTLGEIKKADGFVNFELTNPHYIAALQDQANYLLHKSKIDETTRQRMINLITGSRLQMDTLDELANMITSEFDGISDTRAYLIANTETNQAMSTAQHAFLTENNVKTKRWVGAGPNTCPICQGNEDDGDIGVDESFSSGDDRPPGHPGCECYLDGGEVDLDNVDLWDGS